MAAVVAHEGVEDDGQGEGFAFSDLRGCGVFSLCAWFRGAGGEIPASGAMAGEAVEEWIPWYYQEEHEHTRRNSVKEKP
jgi:hypothetical protein